MVITSGNEQGYYTIASVESETELVIAADADFLAWEFTESSLSFTVTSTYIFRERTDGALADVNELTGTITSTTGGFTGNVETGDMLIIKESDHQGIYKVLSVNSDTQLLINTSDEPFTTQSNIDFDIVKPGMYLQFKKNVVINNPTTGNLTFADSNPDTITRASGSWETDEVEVGDIIEIFGTLLNDGTYTITAVTETVLTLVATDSLVAEVVSGGVGAGLTIFRTFKRIVNGISYGFSWRLFGDGLLSDAYQFVQHQLRQEFDISYGPDTFRGDVTDLLMTYASPTGSTLNMYIDGLNPVDLNNVTWGDATGTNRIEPFVAAGAINFNTNLQNDSNAEYTMFFTNDSLGDNNGYNYGTPNAIIVEDADSNPIAGNISGQPSISFTYDYDGNTQRGSGSDGEDAPVTIVAIGLDTAQFVRVDGTITRSKTNNFSLVSALERNYSNPA